ncbi:hypothetical protein CEXT_22351 [Caerostris extrusa]|uniref:Uncharacterized protein n=1 Tax=Caerostris extrusa TaxID=172846 RepID=A0AAV4VK99_CAEEX|nr:hypothetical protein CEXT_22351 [Caerostris extrusa]
MTLNSEQFSNYRKRNSFLREAVILSCHGSQQAQRICVDISHGKLSHVHVCAEFSTDNGLFQCRGSTCNMAQCMSILQPSPLVLPHYPLRAGSHSVTCLLIQSVTPHSALIAAVEFLEDRHCFPQGFSADCSVPLRFLLKAC